MNKLLSKVASKTLPDVVKSKRALLIISTAITLNTIVVTHDCSPIINAIANLISPNEQFPSCLINEKEF